MRTAAIGFVLACGAIIAGPGMLGGAAASADLLGIDIDILDLFCSNDKKCDGRDDERPGVPQVGINGSVVDEPRSGLPNTTGDGGGVPRRSDASRASNLPPVPTAPSARTVVIRAEPPEPPVPAAPAVPAPAIAPVVPPVAIPPVVVPVVVPPVPAPGGAPAGPAQPAPSPLAPPSAPAPHIDREPPPAQALGSPANPESFRVGYAEHLRAATITGLAAAALPGVAGMLAMTAAGGVLGYRQARAAQTLPPANVANVVRFLP